MNNIGKKFEIYVTDLYNDLGYSNVRHDTHINIPRNGHRVQIDIMYTRWMQKHYVECKYRKSNVGLSEVSKFLAVLDFLRVSPFKGEFVTNSHLSPRAKDYALSQVMQVYELEDLVRLEKKRRGFLRRYFGPEPDIEKLIRKTRI